MLKTIEEFFEAMRQKYGTELPYVDKWTDEELSLVNRIAAMEPAARKDQDANATKTMEELRRHVMRERADRTMASIFQEMEKRGFKEGLLPEESYIFHHNGLTAVVVRDQMDQVLLASCVYYNGITITETSLDSVVKNMDALEGACELLGYKKKGQV